MPASAAVTPVERRDPPPIVVELRRGDMIESRHRGHVAVVDADGAVVEAQGDAHALVYPRSAIKPLQALPLVESGAADAFGVSAAELALACASHSGEPAHVAAVAMWLGRVGLGVDDLECGAHWPSSLEAQHALVRSGALPTPLHNNCSGKHAGMLTTCRHHGEPMRGYIEPEHPAQRRVVAVLEAMCGVDLHDAPRGIDGCGLPQIALPLAALACGMARLGTPDALPAARAAACRRIVAAMAAHPFMLAGTGRFCTRLTAIARGKAVVKTGAEGVYIAALPGRGLGLALKIEDGATRAAEVALAGLIARLAGFDDDQQAALAPLLRPPVVNAAGRTVGALGPASG